MPILDEYTLKLVSTEEGGVEKKEEVLGEKEMRVQLTYDRTALEVKQRSSENNAILFKFMVDEYTKEAAEPTKRPVEIMMPFGELSESLGEKILGPNKKIEQSVLDLNRSSLLNEMYEYAARCSFVKKSPNGNILYFSSLDSEAVDAVRAAADAAAVRAAADAAVAPQPAAEFVVRAAADDDDVGVFVTPESSLQPPHPNPAFAAAPPLPNYPSAGADFLADVIPPLDPAPPPVADDPAADAPLDHAAAGPPDAPGDPAAPPVPPPDDAAGDPAAPAVDAAPPPADDAPVVPPDPPPVADDPAAAGDPPPAPGVDAIPAADAPLDPVDAVPAADAPGDPAGPPDAPGDPAAPGAAAGPPAPPPAAADDAPVVPPDPPPVADDPAAAGVPPPAPPPVADDPAAVGVPAAAGAAAPPVPPPDDAAGDPAAPAVDAAPPPAAPPVHPPAAAAPGDPAAAPPVHPPAAAANPGFVGVDDLPEKMELDGRTPGLDLGEEQMQVAKRSQAFAMRLQKIYQQYENNNQEQKNLDLELFQKTAGDYIRKVEKWKDRGKEQQKVQAVQAVVQAAAEEVVANAVIYREAERIKAAGGELKDNVVFQEAGVLHVAAQRRELEVQKAALDAGATEAELTEAREKAKTAVSEKAQAAAEIAKQAAKTDAEIAQAAAEAAKQAASEVVAAEKESNFDYAPKHNDPANDPQRYTKEQRQAFAKNFFEDIYNDELIFQRPGAIGSGNNEDTFLITFSDSSPERQEQTTNKQPAYVKVKFSSDPALKDKEVAAALVDKQQQQTKEIISTNSTTDRSLFLMVDKLKQGLKKYGPGYKPVIYYPSGNIDALAKLSVMAEQAGLNVEFKCRSDSDADKQAFASFINRDAPSAERQRFNETVANLKEEYKHQEEFNAVHTAQPSPGGAAPAAGPAAGPPAGVPPAEGAPPAAGPPAVRVVVPKPKLR